MHNHSGDRSDKSHEDSYARGERGDHLSGLPRSTMKQSGAKWAASRHVRLRLSWQRPMQLRVFSSLIRYHHRPSGAARDFRCRSGLPVLSGFPVGSLRKPTLRLPPCLAHRGPVMAQSPSEWKQLRSVIRDKCFRHSKEIAEGEWDKIIIFTCCKKIPSLGQGLLQLRITAGEGKRGFSWVRLLLHNVTLGQKISRIMENSP